MIRVFYSLEQKECSDKDFIARTDVWGYTFAFDKQGAWVVLLAGEYALLLCGMNDYAYDNGKAYIVKRLIKENNGNEKLSKKSLQRVVNKLKKSKKDAKHKIADAIIAAYGHKLKGIKND